MLALVMGSLDDGVRKRLRVWMAANQTTLTAIGQAAGYNQPWATRFFQGEFDASLEALAKMAALFKQPVTALFDTTEDPREEGEQYTRLTFVLASLPSANRQRASSPDPAENRTGQKARR